MWMLCGTRRNSVFGNVMFMLGKPVNETWNRELEQITKVTIENLASGSKFLALGSMPCRSFYNYFGLKIVPGSIGIRHQIHLNVLFYFFYIDFMCSRKKKTVNYQWINLSFTYLTHVHRYTGRGLFLDPPTVSMSNNKWNLSLPEGMHCENMIKKDMSK